MDGWSRVGVSSTSNPLVRFDDHDHDRDRDCDHDRDIRRRRSVVGF
jgi:hypothetical protein